ncbi:MAG: hypothetical protein ACOC0G_02175 [Thermodesulfobacteriota bacterium]
MFRFAAICAMLLLLLGACSEDKQQKAPADEPQQATESTDAIDKAKQSANEAVEKAKASTEEAKQAVEKTVDESMKQGESAVEEIKTKADETTQQAVGKANELTASSSQKLNDVTSGLQSKKEDLSAKAESAATDETQKDSDIAPPETIVLENNFGTVTLTHKFHAETYGCPTCHGDNIPGPFELTKDLAHSSMCKDCHQGSGGPVECMECHVK